MVLLIWTFACKCLHFLLRAWTSSPVWLSRIVLRNPGLAVASDFGLFFVLRRNVPQLHQDLPGRRPRFPPSPCHPFWRVRMTNEGEGRWRPLSILRACGQSIIMVQSLSDIVTSTLWHVYLILRLFSQFPKPISVLYSNCLVTTCWILTILPSSQGSHNIW